MAIPHDKFFDLVNLVLTTAWCTFNSQLYQQTDSAAMGGPTYSTTAEIYMRALEKTAISMALHTPKVWEPSESLLMTFIPFLNVLIWKTCSITSTIFIKTLSLL